MNIEGISKFAPVDNDILMNFQDDNDVKIPDDLKEYCILLNETNGEPNSSI